MSDLKNEYADIINHEHHVSKKRPQMSRLNRAAQFSPFAALTGYEDLVEEAARSTNQRHELDDDEKVLLNQQLISLLDCNKPVETTITYFLPDAKKQGGAYVAITGHITHYDEFTGAIVVNKETIIPIDDILEIDFEQLSQPCNKG